MSFKKKPLKQVGAPAYPDARAASTNRREFLAAVGKLSAAGAAMLIAGCDHVTDLANERRSSSPEDIDTGSWAGDIGPYEPEPTLPRDTGEGYLGGDIPSPPPDSDSFEERWVDTGYIDGDIAPPPVDTDTGYLGGDTDNPPIDTDTGYLAGGIEPPPPVDTEPAPVDTDIIDTGAWMGAIEK